METTSYTYSYVNSLTNNQVADLFGVNQNQATGLKNRAKSAVLEGRGNEYLTRSTPRSANGNASKNAVKLDSDVLASLTAACRKSKIEFGVVPIRNALEEGNQAFLAALDYLLEGTEELDGIKQWAGVKTPAQRAKEQFALRLNLALVKLNAAHAAFECYFNSDLSDDLIDSTDNFIESLERLACKVTLPASE